MTEKEFVKLNTCFSSSAILRQIFFIHHIFQLESEILAMSAEEKNSAIKDIEPSYSELMLEKMKVL